MSVGVSLESGRLGGLGRDTWRSCECLRGERADEDRRVLGFGAVKEK